MSKTSTYEIWFNMKRRCMQPSHKSWEYYGGRGVRVCHRWFYFENFLADMGERPAGMTIDRIDTNGDYEPSNCRWVTPSAQARNRRSTSRISAFGETKSMIEWSEDERCEVSFDALQKRLHAGWEPERAISLPKCSGGARATRSTPQVEAAC